jgi:hypothetical protein
VGVWGGIRVGVEDRVGFDASFVTSSKTLAVRAIINGTPISSFFPKGTSSDLKNFITSSASFTTEGRPLGGFLGFG